MKIFFRDVNKEIEIDKDKVLLSDVLMSMSDDFHSADMNCGGKGTCLKCKVVASGNLSLLSDREDEILTFEEKKQNVRFACMAYALGDCEISSFKAKKGKSKILTSGIMPKIDIKPIGEKYGVAFDIGTTTVVGYMYDLQDGDFIGTSALPNPQSVFGGDVISRIEKSLDNKAQDLKKVITQALNKIIINLANENEVSLSDIDSVVITGNTAMMYFLNGDSPTSIATAPFESEHIYGEFVEASSLNLPTTIKSVYLARCCSAFVGGDITTAMLSCELEKKQKPTVMVDIGTNGEMALYSDGKIYCCSTAAGPAFEGAGLYNGMAGMIGAISKVWIDENNEIKYSVIGDVEPIGICGSGVIDLLACMLKLEIVDETGGLYEDEAPEEFSEYFCEVDGYDAFTIPNSKIVVTQKDIRSLQLAKSAICAGMLALINFAKIKPEDVNELLIAGGFGNYLDYKSADAIGLIPHSIASKANGVGNAAGMGSCMILLNKDMVDYSIKIADNSTTVDLSTDPYFNDQYVENMGFEI